MKKGTCMLRDTEVSGDRNVLMKEAPEYFKIYVRDLIKEI
jgi:beta-lactamase regulating signal transducer with metallopeptidase domain